MAFKENNVNQLSLSDPLYLMSEREKRMLDKSWAKKFGDEIFPLINEKRFEPLYSANNATRPNTPVNCIIGALILKELHNLTDDELMENIIFDVRYQYALNTTSFDEQPFSDRTFSRFRERLLNHEKATGEDLLKEEVIALADSLCRVLGMDTDTMRMDSVMVSAHCKNMSRIELVFSSMGQLIRSVQKEQVTKLAKKFDKYTKKEELNKAVYRIKPGATETKLQELTRDAQSLLKACRKRYADSKEFKTLQQVVDEQTTVNDQGKIVPKKGKDIKPDSIQNPNDIDATYRKKAGKDHKGYVGNMVETVDNKDGETTAIITQYDYRPNNYSDHSFCQDVIDELGKQEEKVTLVADGGYFGMDNIQKAADNNIELVTTSLTGAKPSNTLGDFKVDTEIHEITTCPAGHTPTHCSYNAGSDSYRLKMNKSCCEQCPHKDECKAVMQKDSAVITISQGSINRARYAQKLTGEEYKKLQKFRNGVEGVPSVLRRRYHVDEIPVFGFLRSKIWFGLKICAINVSRFLKRGRNTLKGSDISSLFQEIFGDFCVCGKNYSLATTYAFAA